MELVVTITLIGILGAAIGGVLAPAMRAYFAQTQRAALVDAAESALRRMTRDIRIALPNSVRITNTGTGFAVEMLPTVDGGRYCASGVADCNGGSEILGSPSNDDQWDILGCFQDAALVAAGAAGTTAYRMVVGNGGDEVYSATASPSVITAFGNAITLAIVPGTGATPTVCGSLSGTSDTYNRHQVTLAAAHTFSSASARQRLFVIQDSAAPVSFICDSASNTLRRYAGYKSAGNSYSPAIQPTNPLALPLSGATSNALIADKVSACSVTSSTNNVPMTGLVTLSITLTNGAESVTLASQVQLDNSR